MKKRAIKAVSASPSLRLCDTAYNTDNMINAATKAAERGSGLIVFPELSVTGATCADLYLSKTLTDAAEAELKRYAEATCKLEIISVLGLPIRVGESVYNCAAVVGGGKLLGVVPRTNLPGTLGMRSFSEPPMIPSTVTVSGFDVTFDPDSEFDIDGLKLRVSFDIEASIDTMPSDSDITAIITAAPRTVGSYEKIKSLAAKISKGLANMCVIATAGEGESGTDALYTPQNVIAYNGKLLAVNPDFCSDAWILAEAEKEPENIAVTEYKMKKSSPFIPRDPGERTRACGEIFEIQARALAGRIKRAYAKCTVIGVSGGLDSTLAVLVCARAADILGMPRNTVKAVTMPCFGTTVRTKSNAEKLSLALGTDFKTVDIKRAVTLHFEDIGHNEDDYSVVYENAQARERTQVIMDIANAEGGMVVGTGDLSELVLGWATYNGDHMSMYGVNSGIPKTVIRHVTAYCADKSLKNGDIEAYNVLTDVLNTPVSPELLPPKDGEIAQCTEGIVGPYELHDFFLYHLLKNNSSPKEIYSLALDAFAGTEYTPDVIKGWLKVFHRRFFAQQFKRSCLPDGPKIYDISVSPRGGLAMPSDAVSTLWLAEIEALK